MDEDTRRRIQGLVLRIMPQELTVWSEETGDQTVRVTDMEAVRGLLSEIDLLDKEADWLAAAQNDDEEPPRCPEGKEPPSGCIGFNDCVKCWREAARKAVEAGNG